MTLWVTIGFIAIILTFIAIVPLFRDSSKKPYRRDNFSHQIYIDQLDQLEIEVAQGQIQVEAAESAKKNSSAAEGAGAAAASANPPASDEKQQKQDTNAAAAKQRREQMEEARVPVAMTSPASVSRCLSFVDALLPPVDD